MKWNNVIYIIWIMMTQSQKNKYTKIFFTLVSFLLRFNLWSMTQEVLWYKHNKTQKSTEFYRFCTKKHFKNFSRFFALWSSSALNYRSIWRNKSHKVMIRIQRENIFFFFLLFYLFLFFSVMKKELKMLFKLLYKRWNSLIHIIKK